MTAVTTQGCLLQESRAENHHQAHFHTNNLRYSRLEYNTILIQQIRMQHNSDRADYNTTQLCYYRLEYSTVLLQQIRIQHNYVITKSDATQFCFSTLQFSYQHKYVITDQSKKIITYHNLPLGILRLPRLQHHSFLSKIYEEVLKQTQSIISLI